MDKRTRGLGTQSWLHLAAQDERYTLRAAGLPMAVDCGWVEQMLPFIDAYSMPGDSILDPFCGWGTTLLAAGLSGRRGIGVEIEPARVDATRRRLVFHGVAAEVFQGDSACVPLVDDSIDLCLTSIPYFGPWQDEDWRNGSASSAQCYSHADYEAYLVALGRIFGEVARVLKKGGYFVPMVENLHIDGQFVPLAWDCARLLSQHFVMGDERILTYAKPAEDVAGLRSNRAHEYALACRKA